MPRMTRRVVVTGLGATTPLGGDVATTWANAVAGKSGARTMKHEWASTLPVHFAAEVTVEPSEVMKPVEIRRLDRSEQFALIAAREAFADAGNPELDLERLGVVIASGIGGVTSLLEQYRILMEKGARLVSPHTVPMIMPNGPAANVGLEFKAKAGVHTPVSACASGAEAIGYAFDMIRNNRADVVISGGVEASVDALPMAGFAAMKALSTRNEAPEKASRPYDVDRDGFVLGEGGGVLILEEYEHAKARGAKIYCEIAGQGLTSDGYHIAAPDPEGRGVIRAMQLALRDAGLSTKDIFHLNAHATSTPAGDVAEANALRGALGVDADHVAVSATKSMTGHLLGGAGAVESVFIVKALQERLAPPTINIENLDPAVTVDVVCDKARELPKGDIAALNDSFGFGGHDVVLVFKSI
ncbi:MAG: beta-ketoacyl-ACP synthase II [Candidatus Nanopelagicaceae bacterium]